MDLLEIKNNLAKLSYTDEEQPILGRFVVFMHPEKSYVGQVVNLKADTTSNYVIAKLLFTFNSEGIVEDYDGSMPSVSSQIGNLPSKELLNLLPIETPVRIGYLSQSKDMLSLDISVFEQNLTVFAEKDNNYKVFISNCVKQLFQMKEKTVIIDPVNMFEDYPKIKLGVDYKLPLDSKMIDYLFEYELAEVDASTKAVIQDIFYAVQQYINSLDFKFIPIDNFVDVVTNQYKELQMPELALLKNKLLKYRDANILANTKEEVIALKQKLSEKNCSIIDMKDVSGSLQKEVISIIHSTLSTFDKYVYFFVPLDDENSDKKLLRQFLNHNHVFTTMLVSSKYKYADELKKHAQNLIIFAPQGLNNDFAAYNTFLNKLTPQECIVCGKLTQNIPFVIEMTPLKTDLTQDDVMGDRYQFIPVTEELQFVKVDEFGNKIPIVITHSTDETEDSEVSQSEGVVQTEIQSIEETNGQKVVNELPVEPEISEPEEDISGVYNPDLLLEESSKLPPIDTFEDEPEVEYSPENLSEDDLDNLDETQHYSEPQNEVQEPVESSEYEGEEDENELTEVQDEPFVEGETPVVPVYPAEDEVLAPDDDGTEFAQGDTVEHKKYGRGVVEKIIKYGNKTLCSITFENNIGRRLLDPTITEIVKL